MHFHDPLAFSLEAPIGSAGDAWLGVAAGIGNAVRGLGFTQFDRLARHVRDLPYGRPARDIDPLSVLTEGRGTGSTKHRLLTCVAHSCGHYEVTLTVGIFAMSEATTPGVGAVLADAHVESIPEARCYLTIDHQRFDFTGTPRGPRSPLTALKAEFFLTPDAVSERVRALRRQFLAQWAFEQGLSPERAWCVRQACLAAIGSPGTPASSQDRP